MMYVMAKGEAFPSQSFPNGIVQGFGVQYTTSFNRVKRSVGPRILHVNRRNLIVEIRALRTKIMVERVERHLDLIS
jgi:hypothetical protein